MEFSLFYFADDAESEGDRYRLLMSGARFADEHGFAAVWTPERHFHQFGGLFPNPSVTAAAVAAVTTRVKVRAGSVVLPLHHPVRVAEEWAVVDNLSHGRAGVALASGWNPRDFLFRPDAYADRRQATGAAVETLRGIWRGEPFEAGGSTYRIYPRPVQADLPLWLTSSGNPGTFEAAGHAGVGVLTNLLNQRMDALPEKVAAYRRAYADSGRDGRGHVVLMLHTCMGPDLESVELLVREPMKRYLMSALDLNLRSTKSSLSGAGAVRESAEQRVQAWARSKFAPAAIDSAYQRYLTSEGLFGAVSDALPVVERARAADVDEIACLIDFGVPTEAALRGLAHLDELRAAASRGQDTDTGVLGAVRR